MAYQLTDDLETETGEFFQVRGCQWVLGEPQLGYEKKKWFGNTVVCPVCGTSTKLLIDKPISWEKIETSQQERKANAS